MKVFILAGVILPNNILQIPNNTKNTLSTIQVNLYFRVHVGVISPNDKT